MRSSSLPRSQRRDVVRAVVCWAVAVGALLVVSLAADIDPELSDDVVGVGTSSWWVTVLAVTGQAAALVWARSAPRVVLPLLAAVSLVAALAGAGGLVGLTSLAVMVASYVAVVERPAGGVRGPAICAGALTFAATMVTGVRDGDLGALVLVGGALAQAVFVVGAPALVAALVSSRRLVREATERELSALAREQDALVREARAQERTAMARELHDIAAHHLSGMAVMAAAIERQIDSDPDAAREGVRQVRSQSTAVLRDLRRLVGMLRESDAGELSVESLDGIAGLTEQAARLGAPVELVVLPGGDDAPLGAGLGPLAHLSAYRLVQEALANAVQHAPGAPCRVTIDDRDRATVVVTVRNEAAVTVPPARPGSGFGLVGMRERAELTGADLRYGPSIDGGWDVTLRLDRDTTGRQEQG